MPHVSFVLFFEKMECTHYQMLNSWVTWTDESSC